jgi:endonuclease III
MRAHHAAVMCLAQPHGIAVDRPVLLHAIAMVEAPSLERLNDVIDAIGRMEGIGRTMSAVVLAAQNQKLSRDIFALSWADATRDDAMLATGFSCRCQVEAPSLERLNDVIDAIGRMEGIGRTMSAVVLATRFITCARTMRRSCASPSRTV